MPRSEPSPSHNASAGSSAPAANQRSYLVVVRHWRGNTRLGVTAETKVGELKRLLLDHQLKGVPVASVVLCFPQRTDVLDDDAATLRDIGATSQGDALYATEKKAAAKTGPAVKVPAKVSKKRARPPAAHAAKTSDADELARQFMISADDVGVKTYCAFTGAAAVFSVEHRRYEIRATGRSKLAVDFVGNSGKKYHTEVKVLSLPFIVAVLRAVREKSSTKRRRASCSSLKIMQPQEVASRSPPLFWSIVWAAGQGEIAGLETGDGVEGLKSVFDTLVAEADQQDEGDTS